MKRRWIIPVGLTNSIEILALKESVSISQTPNSKFLTLAMEEAEELYAAFREAMNVAVAPMEEEDENE